MISWLFQALLSISEGNSAPAEPRDVQSSVN
jgi:hypothetical protein